MTYDQLLPVYRQITGLPGQDDDFNRWVQGIIDLIGSPTVEAIPEDFFNSPRGQRYVRRTSNQSQVIESPDSSTTSKKSVIRQANIEDYERHVAYLLKTHPIEEAMSIAVGGNYDVVGNIASQVVIYAGAKDGDSILDFGCGSGRVAHHLAARIKPAKFLGTDIVQSLLEYAATKTPDHFTFQLHHELSIPAPDNSFDLAYAFSVFTHLTQAEIYLYLQDIYRTLKPGGTFVFTFLELAEADHWAVFQHTVDNLAAKNPSHLNLFFERSQIEAFASHTRFRVAEFIDAGATKWEGQALGQSIAILKKPK